MRYIRPMKKKSIKSNTDQARQLRDTWITIEDAITAEHSFLLPSGEIDVTVTLPWTREGFLGILKLSWEQQKEFCEGNMRQYRVTIDGDKI